MKKVGERVEKLKQESLKVSIKEGIGASVMNGAGSSFITPFALALNASNFQIGFLSSFVGLIGPLAQLKSSRLMEKFSRKKIVLLTVLLQALIWIPIMLLGLLFYLQTGLDWLPILLIVFYSIHISIGAIAGPAWFSWMGDLVPEKKRGRYFSKRNRITGTVAIISMLLAGFLLDYFKTKGLVLTGFAILFTIAMIARLYSVYLFKKQYHSEIKLKDGYYFSFWQFVSKGIKTNFGKFTSFVSLMNFSVAIASPFFTVYMLRELEFSYIWFTIITLSSSVFSLIAMPFWGKFSDKYGNRLVIILTSIFLPLVPILWIFSTSKLYLVFVPSLVGGIFWAGFNLSAFNFIYDSSKKNHRALCATYHNVLVGIGIFIGAILGGAIAKFSPFDLLGSIFLLIFFISGIARLIVVIIFIPHIKEIRHTKTPPILVREIKFLQSVGHGINYFNSSMISHSHIPHITSRRLGKLGSVFVSS